VSKTFLITELRKNEQGQPFEVQTKIECISLDALIRYLKENPKILWNGNCAIKEDGKTRITQFKSKDRRAQE